MKKMYLSPATRLVNVDAATLMAVSIPGTSAQGSDGSGGLAHRKFFEDEEEEW